MYDIEFTIPVLAWGKYRQRLLDMPKYGFINNGDKKTLVTLLCGPYDTIPDLEWEPGIEVQKIHSPFNDAAQKIYDYFITKFQNNSRWVAKVEDNSLNDISNLVNNLDNDFDWQRDFYLTADLTLQTHEIETKLLNQLGYNWPVLYHEVEAAVLSYTAMHRLLDTPAALQLLQMRAEIPHGNKDLCLAYAARICKIYPIAANCMTSSPKLNELLAGRHNHICSLSDKQLLEWKTIKDNSTSKEITELCSRQYVYSKEIFGKREFVDILHLHPHTKITPSKEFSLWRKSNKLTFLNQNFEPVVTLDKTESGFKGNDYTLTTMIESSEAKQELFIITMPKSGTYLISEILKQLGLTHCGLHISDIDYVDQRGVPVEVLRTHPDLFRIKCKLKDSLRQVLPGQYAFGHLPCNDETRSLLSKFKLIFIHREMRDVLTSWTRYHGQIQTSIAEDKEKETQFKLLEMGEEKLLLFMDLWGEHYSKWCKTICGWLHRDAFTTSFRKLRQANEIVRIAEFIGVDISETAVTQAIKKAINTTTVTSSSQPSRHQNYWTKELEQRFVNLGFENINKLLGYVES